MNEQSERPTLAYYLPFGEMLRVFLDQGCLGQPDLRTVLRERGIFLPDYEKPKAIPHLSFATVTPKEFEDLLEKQRTREDTPKTLQHTMPWKSGRSLTDALPAVSNIHQLLDESVTYKVHGDTGFQPVDGNSNHFKRKFTVEREDLHKSWTRDRSMYDGEIEIKIMGEGKEARIVIVSTAPETRDVAKKVVKHTTDAFKAQGDVGAEEQLSGILFTDFSNAERVAFLLSMAKSNKNGLTLVEVTDYDIGPDRSLSLPAEIEPFLRKVKQLKVLGEELQDSFFLKNVNYHQYVLLSRIEVKFRFEYHAAKGHCVVNFTFAGYSPNNADRCEFEPHVLPTTLDREYKDVNRKKVSQHVTEMVKEFTWEVIEARKMGGQAKAV